MPLAYLIGYLLLVVAALDLFLALIILRQNPRNSPVNKATAACALAASAWSFSSSLMYLSVAHGLDHLLFARLSWVGWFTVPAALQAVLYLRDERSRAARIVGAVLYPFWTAVLGLCLFTDLIVTPGYVPLPYHNSPGPLEMPLRVLGGLTAVWLIVEIVRLRRRTTGYRRSQLGYFLYGTIFFGIGGAVIGGFLQVFAGQGIEPSLSALFSLPWVVMIFYAISRYRLFDTRLILSRALVVLLISFAISALQFLLFRFLEPALGAVASIFISVPLIGIVFFGTSFSRVVQQWINALVLGDRHRYQEMLRQSANAMVTILRRDELLGYIVDSVRNVVGVGDVNLFLQGVDGAFSTRHCGVIERDPEGGCVLPDLIVKALGSGAGPLTMERIDEDRSAAGGVLRETVRRVGAEVVLPLASKGRLLGVLTLGERSNGEPYLPSDLEVLQTLASHAAVAVENAELFEEAVQARALQRESEQIFRTLAETTTAAILILRLDGIIYANRAAAVLSGYRLDQLLSMNPWSLVHPDHREIVFNRGKAWMSGQTIPPQQEFKIITRNGALRWAIATSASIELQGLPAILSTMVDITDLKKAEEEKANLYEENMRHLRQRVADQERFAAVLDTTNDGFWICGSDVRFTFVNDAYCRMLGYTRDELLAMSIKDVEVTETHEMVEQRTAKISREGCDLFETRHRRKDGSTIALEITVNQFGNEDVFFCFGRDITERKKAEADKAKLAAEKENILKDLHDGIGGLTTNINLLAELARTRDDLGEVRRSLATIAELSRESLSEIRSFMQSLDVKDLRWPAVAAELRHLGSTIIEPHDIRFSLTTSLPEEEEGPSSATAMNLFRIYKESLANVVKHARASSVDVSLSLAAGRVRLTVRDDGVGLGGKRGTGRGLLNMQTRAAEMGGNVEIGSDNGTTVVLSVPLA
jgi:PAS domain S-box-containing protein